MSEEKLITSSNDIGLSERLSAAGRPRLVNRDGSFNARSYGASFFESNSIFHWAVHCSWRHFLISLVLGFVLVNLGFALIYFFAGQNGLVGYTGTTSSSRLLDSFYFSVHTFSTLGYGNLHPVGAFTNLVACFQVLVGLLSGAVASGFVFARCSRPTARIINTDAAIISPFKDGHALMFRVANTRNNQVIDLSARVVLGILDSDKPNAFRKFQELRLERDFITFFPLYWTIVHPIDESSPLRGLDKSDFESRDIEVLAFVSGIDDTFSQSVHSWFSYKADEILWNKRFSSLLNEQDDGMIGADLRRLSEVVDC